MGRFGSFMFRMVRGVLATVGLLVVVGWLGFLVLRLTLGGGGKPDTFGSFPSPDGMMKALLAGYSGGGGISPYCNDSVFVVPTSIGEKDSFDKHFEVYSG